MGALLFWLMASVFLCEVDACKKILFWQQMATRPDWVHFFVGYMIVYIWFMIPTELPGEETSNLWEKCLPQSWET
jgi:hypothetical protein